MKARQKPSSTLVAFAIFFRKKYISRRSVFPINYHREGSPGEAAANIDAFSSGFDENTITSTSPAEHHDFSITFPSMSTSDLGASSFPREDEYPSRTPIAAKSVSDSLVTEVIT